MQLQKYHIHNVLRAYSQQLARREKSGCLTESEPNALCLAPHQKRMVIIRKVTDNIASKMKQLGDKQDKQSTRYLSKNSSHAPTRFIYNTIDDRNRKLMHTILIDDSTFLINS